MEIPNTGRILLYGPAMINVESLLVRPSEYHQLPELWEYMARLMRGFNGIGIAAPEVGVFKSFCLIHLENGSILDLVNPVISNMHGLEREGFEACLSIPPNGNGCQVPRMQNITVQAGTVAMPEYRTEYELTGMDAVVAQHEIDHLNGVFFIDRVAAAKKRLVLDTFKKWQDEKAKERDKCKKQFPTTVQ